MKRTVFFICLILFFSLTVTGCNKVRKSDNPSAAEVIASSTNQMTAVSSDINKPYKNRTEDLDRNLFKEVDNQSSTPDKLKILFKALKEDSSLDENYKMYNCDNVLTHTMNLLYDFLGTEQSFNISDNEFEKLLGFPVMPLKEGRIIRYEGKPENFGESSDSKYIFYQCKRGNTVSAYKLYFKDYRRITDAFVINTGVDSSIIYTYGFTSMNSGSRHFIHAFKIDSKTCTKVDALGQYMYENKEFIDSDGLIPYEFEIEKFTEEEIIFKSGENINKTLKAYFNSSKMEFVI
ncbi:hypothetical protein [Ruminiclostridium cellobioparum]|uniref:Lipoprotein n=1 Tax=Ruminiclostridium cellobioparum subsp. termitidis CT1112 TaxID=1195236 RepID=S0FR21_RUMCE|nr:hypothetical protein [Ruminiclostridium cellobioparum]EMS72816.1 hypothetical protein CTER_1360 [Ruminiclostridium cellobioparum subsp. termitidis CT1112]